MCLARLPDRMGSWKCWFLRRRGNRSTQRKTTRSNGENQQETKPTSRCRRRDLNPGNIGGRRELSPLRFPGLHAPPCGLGLHLTRERLWGLITRVQQTLSEVTLRKKVTTNKPERNSIADCKKRTTIATNDVDSRFSYSKNNCGVVTVFYRHSPKTREKAIKSSHWKSFNSFGKLHFIEGFVRNKTIR